MHIHQDRPASSGQWLRRHDLLNFITTLYEGDLHAKRVLSLAKDSDRYKVARCIQAEPVFCGFGRSAHSKVISVSVLAQPWAC